MDCVKSNLIDTRPNESTKPYYLDDYLDDTLLIPVGKFSEDRVTAIAKAIEYLKTVKHGSVIIPPESDSYYPSYLAYRLGMNQHDVVNYVCPGKPEDFKECPIERDGSKSWQLDDMIVNLDYAQIYRARSWVCTKAGSTEAEWSARDYDQRFYSAIEVVSELPPADQYQEGRMVIYKTATTEQFLYCVNNSGNTATTAFEWVEVGGSAAASSIYALHMDPVIVSEIPSEGFNEGDPVNLDLTISNSGSEDLVGVSVANTISGFAFDQSSNKEYVNNGDGSIFIPKLTAGQEIKVSGTYEVSLAKDQNQVIDNFTGNNSFVASTSKNVKIPTVKGEQAYAVDFSSDKNSYHIGDEAIISVKISNTGNLTLENIHVSTNTGSLDKSDIDKLISDESDTLTATVALVDPSGVINLNVILTGGIESQVLYTINYSVDEKPIEIPESLNGLDWDSINKLASNASITTSPNEYQKFIGNRVKSDFGVYDSTNLILVGINHDSNKDGKIGFTFVPESILTTSSHDKIDESLENIYDQMNDDIKRYVQSVTRGESENLLSILSDTEIIGTVDGLSPDGNQYEYFSNLENQRIFNYNGNPIGYWTRTKDLTGMNHVMDSNGNLIEAEDELAGVLPVISIGQPRKVLDWGARLSSLPISELGQLATAISDDPVKYTDLIGQSTTINMGDYGNQEIVLIGIMQDKLSENGNLAMLTWQFKNALFMHEMNSKASTNGGWKDSSLRNYLNSELMEQFPDEIKSLIQLVDKNTYNGITVSKNPRFTEATGSDLTVTQDKVFVLSTSEIGINTFSGSGNEYPIVIGENDTYDYYFNKNSKESRIKSLGGNPIKQWTRSISVYDDSEAKTSYRVIDSKGVISPNGDQANVESIGVSPVFCTFDSGVKSED